MTRPIFIVTSSFDLTVDYLIHKYSHVDFFRFNLDLFHEYELSINPDETNISNISRSITLENCRSIYYRKPQLPNLKNIFPEQYHTFAHKEVFNVMEGMIESCDQKCLSKPSLLRLGNNKVYQLKLAKKLDFMLPKSSISNKGSSGKNNIVKPISTGSVDYGDKKEVVQTNLVNDSYSLESLKYCPAYFQEYIDKEYEVRLTIVGNFVFPVKISSENNVDWRTPDNNVKYELISIPEEIINKSKQLLSALNLRFGCLDFIIKDNDFYFLEVNTNGQWLWLEKELNLNISEKILEELGA